ncbi:hypothetical protein VUR80DRAFT_5516 [Thermomyces stellatus]
MRIRVFEEVGEFTPPQANSRGHSSIKTKTLKHRCCSQHDQCQADRRLTSGGNILNFKEVYKNKRTSPACSLDFWYSISPLHLRLFAYVGKQQHPCCVGTARLLDSGSDPRPSFSPAFHRGCLSLDLPAKSLSFCPLLSAPGSLSYRKLQLAILVVPLIPVSLTSQIPNLFFLSAASAQAYMELVQLHHLRSKTAHFIPSLLPTTLAIPPSRH